MSQRIGNSGTWDAWSLSLYLCLWPCWQGLKTRSSEVCFCKVPPVNWVGNSSSRCYYGSAHIIRLLTKLFFLGALTKVKKCEWAYGHWPCHKALLLLPINIQFWYSTLWSLFWYCFFDILNVTQFVTSMYIYNSLDKLPEKLLDQKIKLKNYLEKVFIIWSRLFKMPLKKKIKPLFKWPTHWNQRKESVNWRPFDKVVKFQWKTVEWKLEAMETVGASLIVQASLVEILNCHWVHRYVSAVSWLFGIFIWSSELIAVSVLSDHSSCSWGQSWILLFEQFLRITCCCCFNFLDVTSD